jgi:hypothetical protein
MSGYWGIFLLTTSLVAPGWYLGDRIWLRPKLRTVSTRLLTVAIVLWLSLGVAVILALAVALMHGNPAAITVALFVNSLAAGIIWGVAPRVGQGVPEIPEAAAYDRACGLLSTVHETARRAPLSDAQRTSILEQADAVPGYIAESLRKVARLRRIGRSIYQSGGSVGACCSRKELAELRMLETRLISAIEAAVQVLVVISVALMKVEMARDERVVARILGDLSESNRRMLDLADSWEEVARYSLSAHQS